ncbi:MAG: band 7 protein [Rhodobacter sp.]|nr:band 7 protein [Rhodobacter sp.]
MAQIRRFPFLSHIQSEASNHLTYHRCGALRRSGRGLAFWLDPTVASISEVPMADREMSFVVNARSSDFQDLAVQGSILWRVLDPGRLAERVDFTLDLKTGKPVAEPEGQIIALLTGLVREFADSYIKGLGVRAALEAGLSPLQAALNAGLAQHEMLGEMGLSVITARVAALRPSSELARALQAPTFESLQQKADEATFARRALAVDKERAIAENELANQIELAARRAELIARVDANARSEAEAQAAADRIATEAEAANAVTRAEAEAARIRLVETAAVAAERDRMAVLAGLPVGALYALAAREFAAKLDRIDSLTVSPDMISGLINQVRALTAGAPK